MTFYGTDVWDPQLILAQMAVLQAGFPPSSRTRLACFAPAHFLPRPACAQCLHYLTVGLLLAMAHWVLGEPVTLDMIFSFKIVSFSTSVGWLACVVHLLAGLAGYETVCHSTSARCHD